MTLFHITQIFSHKYRLIVPTLQANQKIKTKREKEKQGAQQDSKRSSEVFYLSMAGNTGSGVEWHVRPPNPKNPIVFFDITIGNIPAGRIKMELFADIAPKTAENFRSCHSLSLSLKNSLSHFLLLFLFTAKTNLKF